MSTATHNTARAMNLSRCPGSMKRGTPKWRRFAYGGWRRRIRMSGSTRRSVKGREGDRVVSTAVVVATGVRAEGDRKVLALDVGLSEDSVHPR